MSKSVSVRRRRFAFFEQLETRDLMAVVGASSQVSLTLTGGASANLAGSAQEQQIKQAFREAEQLSQYTTEELQATTQWVIQVDENTNITQLAQQLGSTLTLEPLIPDTYIYTTPSNKNRLTIGAELQQHAAIEHAYPLVARVYDKYFVPNDPLYNQQWHLNNTGQAGGLVGADANIEGAWDLTRGAGVIIAIVDDSLQYTHPDLQAKYHPELSMDIRDGDNDPAPVPGADDFHGTAVAGVAAASTNNGIGVAGAAPDAELAAVRMIGGPLTDAQLASAFTWHNQEIHIYNNSWGAGDSGILTGIGPLALAAIQQAVATGRGGLGNVIVFAAGNGLQSFHNSNYHRFQNLPYVISVANINDDGRQSASSEPGDNILIAAYSATPPLESGVVTTDLLGNDGYNSAPGAADDDPLPDLDYTSQFGGTSSAAPLVSGVIALMLSANPNLTWRDVKHILVKTAVKNHATDGDWAVNGAGLIVSHKYGYGAIDAEAAVRAAQTWTNVGPELIGAIPTTIANLPIPDNNPVPTVYTVNVLDNMTIETVEITLDITHLFPQDLQIELVSPAGTRSILAETRPVLGLTSMQGGFTFTSTHFWDETTIGNWRIEISDRDATGVGTFNSFSMNFYGTQVVVPTTGAITGTVWSDANSNRVRDAGEVGIAGATVFIDANANGTPDVGEPTTTTIANGAYSFPSLPPGSWRIDVVPVAGYNQTFPVNGIGQVVNVVVGQTSANVNFGFVQQSTGPIDPNPPIPPPPPPALISGIVRHDLNNNGLADANEPGIPNIIVFLDIDNDGKMGLGEPAQTTNSAGQYGFYVRAGNYTVRQAAMPGWAATAPAAGYYSVSVNSGDVISDQLFSNYAAIDWGDAPATFPTLASQNGANHSTLPGMYLGSGIDGEADGKPSLKADGDDNSSIDDDDGVVFVTPIVPGQNATIDVTVHNGGRASGVFQGWIDFNGDGDWNDPGERIFTDVRMVEGVNRLTFAVPANAVPGNGYARFRYGYGQNINYYGNVLGGEVEDYVAKIVGPKPVAKPDAFTVQKNSTNNVLDVIFNDAASTQGIIGIIGTTMGSLGGTITIDATNQTLKYTPRPDTLGVETFNYTISDFKGGLSTATVTVTIENAAVPPTAVDDTIRVLANSMSNTINIYGNDRLGSSPLQILLVPNTTVAGGSLSVLQPGNIVQYTPRAGFVGLDQFQYIVRDTSGMQSLATVTLHVGDGTANDLVGLELAVTDLDGNVITEVEVGQEFQVRAYVRDLRAAATDPGVQAAYMDLLYASNLVTPVPGVNFTGVDLTFAPEFNLVRSGSSTVPGLINEVGATRTTFPDDGGPTEFFRLNFTAVALGMARFLADPADEAMVHDVRLADPIQTVAPDKITYGLANVSIVTTASLRFQNQRNVHDVDGDGVVAPLDVLLIINELNARGASSVAGRPQTFSQPRYWDVNGDNRVNLLDVAILINYLNSGGRGEFVEPVAEETPVVTTEATTVAANSEVTAVLLPGLFDEVEETPLTGSVAAVAAAEKVSTLVLPPYLWATLTQAQFTSQGASDDEELEDLFEALADDIDQAWQLI